jgi:hypothetical protein
MVLALSKRLRLAGGGYLPLHQSDNGETSTYDGRERHPPPHSQTAFSFWG